jgi:mannosyltransferase
MLRSALSSLRAALSRGPTLSLLAVTVVAALLRLHDVGADGLSSDEAFSWRLVGYPWADMLGRAAADVHPPLFYLLLKPWLAAWGDAPLALRGLSVLLGVLLVPLVYALVRETQRLTGSSESPDVRTATGAALLAALLVAVHPAQVLASQNARMYSLSAALAALATLLLLRALRTGRGWLAYGAAVAAACATHYYAFFTVAAHVVGAGAFLIAARETHAGPRLRAIVRGFAVAGAVSVLLYAAWLPAFLRQVARVEANYWIPSVSWTRVATAFASWASGLERGGLAGAATSVTVLIGLATLAALWRATREEWFLLLQAAVPWLLSLALSIVTPRSIFLPRYLVPVQIFFLAFWAVRTRRCSAVWMRVSLAVSLVAVSVFCLVRAKAQVPDEPLAEARAAAFLAERHQAGDVVLTNSPRASNRMRYYLAQKGLRSPEVHCLLAPAADDIGHFAHTASLESGELIAPQHLASAEWRRLWWGTPASTAVPLPAAGWQEIVIRHFSGGGGTDYMLARYVRATRVPGPRSGP